MPGPGHRSPAAEIVTVMSRVYGYGLTTMSGGNISVRSDRAGMWITPAGVDKGNLTAEDIVRINEKGRVAGRLKPSTEHPVHAAVYAARPDIKALIHAHPVSLVTFSLMNRVPETSVIPQAHAVCGEVDLAPFALPGSEELGRNIARAFSRGAQCVVLENHGVAVGGADLQQAFERFETLEFCAHLLLRARRLGKIRHLSDRELAAARHSKNLLPEAAAPKPTLRESVLRSTVRDLVRRGCGRRLMASTEGSLSTRLNDRSFLITPHGLDRWALEPEDVVLIRDGRRERNKLPSKAVTLHAAIYKKHPEVQAVINSHSPNITAFSVTGLALETRAIPESYILLRKVRTLAYGLQFTNEAAVAEAVSLKRPVVLLQNDGFIAVGRSAAEAYDRMEVAELTAQAIIDAKSEGGLRSMSPEVIAEIEAKFPA
jgi:L-fuculose-phosphate aldolase